MSRDCYTEHKAFVEVAYFLDGLKVIVKNEMCGPLGISVVFGNVLFKGSSKMPFRRKVQQAAEVEYFQTHSNAQRDHSACCLIHFIHHGKRIHLCTVIASEFGLIIKILGTKTQVLHT